jgi:O-antigen ligase
MWMYPTQSHNGFLEITNDLGFVGLTVLMCYVVVYIRQSLSVFKFDRTEGALFIAIMFQQIIVNLQEAVWITPKVSSSVMTMFATVAVGRMLLERQRQLQGRPKQPRKAVGGT